MATSNELTNEYSPLTEMRLLAEGQMHSSQIAELMVKMQKTKLNYS